MWKKIDEDNDSTTHQAEIDGGFLYKVTVWNRYTESGAPSVSLCFVPDVSSMMHKAKNVGEVLGL